MNCLVWDPIQINLDPIRVEIRLGIWVGIRSGIRIRIRVGIWSKI